MKASELKQIIKEEISKVLKEASEQSKKIYASDLKVGEIYRSTIEIMQGKMKGQYLITDQEYLGKDGNLVFKVVKIHTPDVAKELNVKVGDESRTGEGAIPRDYKNTYKPKK